MEKNITAANHAAAWILNQTEASFIGRKMYEVMPQLEENYLDRVLCGDREIMTTTILIGKESYMVSIAPIAYDGGITGAIISIHKIPTGSRKSQDLFGDSLLFGYLSMGDFCKIDTRSEQMVNCSGMTEVQQIAVLFGEGADEEKKSAALEHAAIARS